MTGKNVGWLSAASKPFPKPAGALTDDIKTRQAHIPWAKVAGIGKRASACLRSRRAGRAVKLAQDDLPALEKVCQVELEAAERREGR